MEAFLIYLLKVSATAILFYLFIRILMERETQHEYIRALWIGTILVSLVLPFIYVPVPDLFPDRVETTESISVVLHDGGDTVAESSGPVAESRSVSLTEAAGAVYVLGAVAVLIMYAVSHARLAAGFRRYTLTREYDTLLSECAQASGCRTAVKLYVTDDRRVDPFSWMDRIVVSREDMENDGRDIILHEMGHIGKGHSWDILLTEFFTCLLWFNPVSWLVQYSLRQIHEYSADCTVLRSGADAREYQRLLIRKAAGTAFHSIANSFNHSNLKNRITMMLQNQTSKRAYAKSLSLLPVTACLLLVFSASGPAKADKVNENFPESQEIFSAVRPASPAVEAVTLPSGAQDPAAQSDDPVPFKDVGEKPSFNGGDANDFSRWVCEHLVYPEEARNANISGRVTLKFVIEIDGSVTGVEVLRGADPVLDKEAVRVVSSSPKWTPGKIDGKPVRVAYVFPVLFNLTGKADGKKAADSGSGIIFNGQPVTQEELENSITFHDVKGHSDGTVTYLETVTPLASKKDFLKFANTMFVYPPAAKDAGSYGKVTASFKIGKDGSVYDITVKESPDNVLSSEVERVIAKSPKWTGDSYRNVTADGQGSMDVIVSFMLRYKDADGNTVTLGSDGGDEDITVIAYN